MKLLQGLLFALFNHEVIAAPKSGLRGLQANSFDAPIYPLVIDPSTSTDVLTGMPIPANAASAGMWSRVETWPIVAIHTAVLPNGKLVTYGAPTNQGVQDGRSFTFWDPNQGFRAEAFSVISSPAGVDSFCSSGALLSDGTFLTSGGGSAEGSTRSLESSILNYRTQTARRAENLYNPRWYGTTTKLPDGRAIITGGASPYVTGGFMNPLEQAAGVSSTPEVYTEGQGWELLTGAFSLDAFGAENNRYWYPRQWVTPVGTVFGISTDKMWEMSTEGNGTIKTLGDIKTPPNLLDPTTKPNVGPTSSAVMYDVGKIIQMGGNGYANGYASDSSAFATLFDISDIARGNILVTETAAMSNPRQWHNSVVLPDGRVLVTGGTRKADNAGVDTVLPAEIWNPATGSWITGASAAIHRSYHHSTALLPDGSVFSGGSGVPGPVTNFNAEIYFPPYFFERNGRNSDLAKRPRIESISTNSLLFGDQLEVELGLGDVVTGVSLCALPAVTHSFDSNQRHMKLQFQQVEGTSMIKITMPSTANLAPPGYYYVSVLNEADVPSESIIISLESAAPPVPSATPFEPITGPFTVDFSVRFDSIAGGHWQRVFDFGNGPRNDNVWAGQLSNGSDMVLEVWRGSAMRRLVATDSLVAGELSAWRVGVDASGQMWIEKNGARIAEGVGLLPRNVYRANMFVGSSNWAADTPLVGAVFGLKIANREGFNGDGFLNVPKQINGAFTVDAVAVFNSPLSDRFWQRIFDFGNGDGQDNVLLCQLRNTTDLSLDVWRDGVNYRVVAREAIVQGELASWRVGIDITGLMWIEKNGIRIATGPGVVPRNVFRRKLLVGQSNWAADSPLVGAVLGLTVSNADESNVPEQITGAFTAEVSARFDNLRGGQWQRVFDFGNGPASDNVLLTQLGPGNDMSLEVWRDGVNHRVFAAGAIIEGELADWRVGVDPTGLMWIEKNGVRIASGPGAVPRDVYRANMLFGDSNWAADTTHIGAILGHDITNQDESSDRGLMNIPGQIRGAFTVQVSARFDDVKTRSWQRVFDFGNGPEFDNILFGQLANTNNVVLDVWREGTRYRVVAGNAINPGELAIWKVGVAKTGLMFIEKNGNRLAETPGMVPRDVTRKNLLVGYSNWLADANLDGVVLGLRVYTGEEAFAYSS